MIKFKNKSTRPVQIADSLTVLAVLVGVITLYPEPRSIAYDVYTLIILLLRVLIPFFSKSLKFRYYMTLRYLVLSIAIGFATLLFQIFSKTHPALYFMVLGVTFTQELITNLLF